MAKRKAKGEKSKKSSISLYLFGIILLLTIYSSMQSAKDKFEQAYEIFINSELIRSEWNNQRCPEQLNNSVINIIHINKYSGYISCWRGVKYKEVKRSPAKFENCSKEDMKNIENAVRVRYSCWFPLDKILPNSTTDYYAITAACYVANKPEINYRDVYISCYGYALPHSILYAVVDLKDQKVFY